MPVVDVVGVVTRAEDTLDAVLITRHLDYSLPYRTLFSGPGLPDLGDRLLDAGAELLVRLHLAGFFWGDCSLSNTLFRRDAGALSAYLVDAETGELHQTLSSGQRQHDLEIAEENLVGELARRGRRAGRPLTTAGRARQPPSSYDATGGSGTSSSVRRSSGPTSAIDSMSASGG